MLSVSDVAKLSGKQKPRNYHQVLAFSPTIVLAIRKNPRREGALTAVTWSLGHWHDVCTLAERRNLLLNARRCAVKSNFWKVVYPRNSSAGTKSTDISSPLFCLFCFRC